MMKSISPYFLHRLNHNIRKTMSSKTFSFEIVHTSRRSQARVGRIYTPHGTIDTPTFVPVATHAALKSVDALIAERMPIELMFCNTYHLMLHPGAEVVGAAGGLHAFMQRSRPIITDSGGFQVFSLAYGGVHAELKSKGKKIQSGSVLSINEEGITFRSYRDGAKIILTPESSVHAQKLLGADIILPLDELLPYHTQPDVLQKSFARTHRWQERSLVTHQAYQNNQAMYGIVHGGIDPVLRAKSCAILRELPFNGFAIGGSLGRDCTEMTHMLTAMRSHLPSHYPVHLLGIGDLPSIQQGIPLGIDTFDSAYPTRNARHGVLLTQSGPVNITRSEHRNAHIPVDDRCDCMVCARHTRAYLHHLFKAHELSAYTLATIHNVHFMIDLMRIYREQILNDAV